MMVTARKVSEGVDEVRYEFGLDRRFDRVLVIDKASWAARTEDDRFDSAAGAVAARSREPGRRRGSLRRAAVFAS
jgi:hypothetical protein